LEVPGAAEAIGSWLASRRRFLFAAAAGLVAPLAGRADAAGRRTLLSPVRLETSAAGFAGDNERLATVSPIASRKRVQLHFSLERPADVSIDLLRTGQGVASEQPVNSGAVGLTSRQLTLSAGKHTIDWEPAPTLAPRTYVLSVSARERRPRGRAGLPSTPRRVVVRLLGVDAAFTKRSAAAGEQASLVVRTDARSLKVDVVRCGPEPEPTYANNELKGVPVTLPRIVDWTAHRDTAFAFKVGISKDWESGIYAVRMQTDDGRIGFAPIVVRPPEPRRRIAVVVPTTTWQAYNFYDADGDGWGDTWYARWARRTST
jgi:hypothetical protein